MQTDEIENNPELQQVLWACYQYWRTEAAPPHERVICYKWVLGPYKNRFGKRFHNLKLHRLSELGFLEKEETARTGHRRYYRLADPEKISNLLGKWQLGEIRSV